MTRRQVLVSGNKKGLFLSALGLGAFVEGRIVRGKLKRRKHWGKAEPLAMRTDPVRLVCLHHDGELSCTALSLSLDRELNSRWLNYIVLVEHRTSQYECVYMCLESFHLAMRLIRRHRCFTHPFKIHANRGLVGSSQSRCLPLSHF